MDLVQQTHIEADVAVSSSSPCWLTATKSIHTAVEVDADERKSVTVSKSFLIRPAHAWLRFIVKHTLLEICKCTSCTS